jgi:hypothetical protein
MELGDIPHYLDQWFQTCDMRTPWEYAEDLFGVRKNNIGNGGEHKKGFKITTQKQSYEALVYKERLM